MIAYNNDWLNNLLLRHQADKAVDHNCITSTEKEQVYAAYPVGFYTPNVFVRIGLFVLTIVILIFTMGLISLLVLSSGSEKAFGGLFIFFGCCAYAALELMIKNKHYRSGVDDALTWAAGACIIGGLNGLSNISAQANALIVFLLALLLFLRFSASLMAAVAGLALLALLFFTLVKFGETAKAVTPFVLMIASAVLYFFSRQWLHSDKWKHYHSGLLLLSITALICFYAAGNYFVVREASVAMFNLYLKEGQDIPFGWLFWVFTVAVPVLYIVRGIQKKDAVLLRVGLLLVAVIIFTVRYYYHVLPAEIAMVLGGIVLIVLAYALIKYLQQPKYGFTCKEPKDKFFMDKLQVEGLLIAQTFSGPPQVPADTGTQFGGGSGSGGGASGQF